MQQSGRARDNIPLVYDIGRLDPNGGVLAHLTCWRPRPGDPNPEQPGEKLFMKSYIYQLMLKLFVLVAAAKSLAPVASRYHIGDHSAQIQACKDIA